MLRTFTDSPPPYQPRLRMPGLDIIPARWLHLTMQGIEFTDEVSAGDVDTIVVAAERCCREIQPFAVAVGPAVVDPEVVRLKVSPAAPVARLRAAIRAAIADAWSADGVPEPAEGFCPHLSLAYSNSAGPAQPVITAVAADEPRPATATVNKAELIVLNRDNREYQWEPHATVALGHRPPHTET